MMSNRTTSPSSFSATRWASVPPIWPAPTRAIFFRAMRAFSSMGNDTAGRGETERGLSRPAPPERQAEPRPAPRRRLVRPISARADCGSVRGGVAGEAEPSPGILGGDGGERGAERLLEGLLRAGADRP